MSSNFFNNCVLTSLYFFYQEFTVILTQYRNLLRVCLHFNLFGNIFDIFLRALISLLHLIFSKASSAEVTFSFVEDRTCIIQMPPISTSVCDFFGKYARNFSLSIFYQAQPGNNQQDSQMYFQAKYFHSRFKFKCYGCSKPFLALKSCFY